MLRPSLFFSALSFLAPAATAQNVNNYWLAGPSGRIPVTSAVLDGTGRVATLSFAAQNAAGSYSLRVGGISDLAGNVSPSFFTTAHEWLTESDSFLHSTVTFQPTGIVTTIWPFA